ncbi:MAG TPA: ubiquinone/menaquinone biosynthesis methyltransferase [Ignavibacteria bacterium]|nr:ubiquinone/menaquinone biosynthesis methyltransferase [Ignavibacteria bacterium]HMR41083.1 ubiquinone/menaquinone biosynthesis methyltransferase [Ignavibacteria bacterium]
MDKINNLDKSGKKIESMFDEIAPTYDKLNHLFTLNIDNKWRSEIVEQSLEKKYRSRIILDLASGTGDLTKELLKLDPQRIIAADISSKMLEIQSQKISDQRLELIQANADNMPFDDSYFDIITIGFGIRNFEDLGKSLKEIRRVLKPDGKLIILEMFKSRSLMTKLFNVYFGKVMPYFGNRISKSKYAYSYLFNSVDSFYTPGEFIEICLKEGYDAESSKNNFLGIVNTVYLNNNKV